MQYSELTTEVMDTRDVEFEVVNDILMRKKRGMEKYGTSVANNPLPLREWLQHQYEELLDAAIYCKRAMWEIDNARKTD